MAIGDDLNKGKHDLLTTENFVKTSINSSKVVIFSKQTCPYCEMVKDIFNELYQPFKAIELDRRADQNEIQEILRRMTGERTVPRVFIKGKFVGGAEDTQTLFHNGELRHLLKKDPLV